MNSDIKMKYQDIYKVWYIHIFNDILLLDTRIYKKIYKYFTYMHTRKHTPGTLTKVYRIQLFPRLYMILSFIIHYLLWKFYITIFITKTSANRGITVLHTRAYTESYMYIHTKQSFQTFTCVRFP